MNSHQYGLRPQNYDFNDALLPVGSTYWVRLLEAFFGRE
jgi:hippurate hydrolase